MDKTITYKYGSAMDDITIEVKLTCDHNYKLLNGIEHILLNTLEVIHDLRLKSNEDGLRMSEEEKYNINTANNPPERCRYRVKLTEEEKEKNRQEKLAKP